MDTIDKETREALDIVIGPSPSAGRVAPTHQALVVRHEIHRIVRVNNSTEITAKLFVD